MYNKILYMYTADTMSQHHHDTGRRILKHGTALIAVLLMGLLFTGVAAAENHTVNDTETTDDPVNDTADESAGDSDASFQVSPDVRLRPIEDTVDERQPGVIELFVNNPSLNDATVSVDVSVSVPSNIHVTGEGLASGSGGGTVTGAYEVEPGTSRTITMRVFPTQEGDFTIDGRVLYWPDDNEDSFNQISLSHSFSVEGVPDQPGEGSDEGRIPDVPQSFILLVLAIGLAAAIVMYAKKSGADVEIME